MSSQSQIHQEQIAIAEENERERESLFQLYEQNIGRHGLALEEIGRFSKQVEMSLSGSNDQSLSDGRGDKSVSTQTAS